MLPVLLKKKTNAPECNTRDVQPSTDNKQQTGIPKSGQVQHCVSGNYSPYQGLGLGLVQSYTSMSSNLFYYEIFYLERRHKSRSTQTETFKAATESAAGQSQAGASDYPADSV